MQVGRQLVQLVVELRKQGRFGHGLIVAAGWWFAIHPIEWAMLGLTVFLVLAMEAVNTAVEATIDLVSPRYHPLAKIAKDTAAGAMIFAVLGSLWVAIAIFGPRLWQLFFA